MINAIIIDDNQLVVSNLISHFKNNEKVCIVKTFNNGEDGLEYIDANPGMVDLIIMDLLIPRIDGLALLDELNKRGLKKKVIVVSNYKDENTIQRCLDKGISYYIVKPFSILSLENRITEIFNDKHKAIKSYENIDLEISQILHNLGIPSHIRGYKYIRDGILLIYNNESVSFITKEVYPQIASKYETTPSRVERAIRHAIEVSWLRGDLALMEELFGFSVSCDRAKPTNSEFLTTIADRIKMNRQ